MVGPSARNVGAGARGVKARRDRMSHGSEARDLVATMDFSPDDGIAELDEHLRDLSAQAEALGFSFNRHGARNELQAATFRLRDARTIRLAVSPSGAIAIETRPMGDET